MVTFLFTTFYRLPLYFKLLLIAPPLGIILIAYCLSFLIFKYKINVHIYFCSPLFCQLLNHFLTHQ